MRSFSSFTRFVCLFVLVSFLPASVEFWNFLPSSQAQAEEAPQGVSDVLAWSDILSRAKAASDAATHAKRMQTAKRMGNGVLSDVMRTRPLTEMGDRSAMKPSAPRFAVASSGAMRGGAPTSLGDGTSGASADMRLAKVRVIRRQPREAAPAPQETVVESAPAGGTAVKSAAPELVSVDAARAMLASGNYADGAAALLTRIDWDENTTTRTEADSALRLLWREMEAGSLKEEQLDAVEAALPAWGTIGSAEAATASNQFLMMRARVHERDGAAAEARDCLLTAQLRAAEIMEVFPESPMLLDAADMYMEASRRLGGDTLREASVWCMETAGNPKSPKALAFSVRAAASTAIYREWGDRATAFVMEGDILSDGGTEQFKAWTGAADVFPWLKAGYHYALAMAKYDIGMWGRAVESLDAALAAAPAGDELVYRAALARAFVLNRLNFEDYDFCLKLYQDYLDRHPESPYIDRALMYMGDLYQRAENFRAAYDVYGRIISLYPGGAISAAAEQGRRFLEENVLNSAGGSEIPDDMPVLNPPKLAMACGQEALHRMLALQGVGSGGEELTRLAGASDDGAKMSQLRDAALAKGLALAGVECADLSKLPVPFIAHTNINHYYLVTGVSEASVTVRGGGTVRSLSREEFAAQYSGLALVPQARAEGLTAVEPERLMLAKGGLDPIWPPYTPPSCPNGDCPTPCPPHPGAAKGPKDGGGSCGAGDADSGGTFGGPGMALGGSAGPGAQVPGGIESGTAVFGSGITAPEMQFSIMGRQSAQFAKQVDLSVPVHGGELSLEFAREYFNPWGTPKNVSPLYDNHRWLGVGWWHTYADFAVFSTNVVEGSGNPPAGGWPPVGIAAEVDQNTRYYRYHSTNTQGISEYRIDGAMEGGEMSGGAQTEDLGNKMFRDDTTGVCFLRYPNGKEIEFDANGRLQEIRDANGNALTLWYDNGVLRVYGPDDRFLEFSFNNNGGISGVTLYEVENSQEVALRTISYGYDSNQDYPNLTTVTYPGNKTNTFGYGKRFSNDAYSSYISDYGDRSAKHTLFDMSYGYDPNNGTWYRALGIEVRHVEADDSVSLSSVYEVESVSGYGDLVLCQYAGTPSTGSLLSKGVFRGDASAFHNSEEQFFGDAAGTTKRIWGYGYSHDYYRDLSVVVDPSSQLTYTYAHNDNGMVTSMKRTPASPALTFEYDTAGLRPIARTDPDGARSTYEYDSRGNLTRYYHPQMGTGDTEYTYDSHGNLTSVSDPLNHTWTYTYDSRGNQTSITDPLSNCTVLSYDDFGRVGSVTDPANKSTFYEYTDAICAGCGGVMAQVARITDHEDNETYFAYDDSGMLVSVENALGEVVEYAYDSMHRLVEISHGDDGAVIASYAYDELNRVLAACDGAGNSVQYGYNFLGDLVTITDAEGQVELNYYTNGNLRQLVDGKDNITNFYYWNKGGLAKMVNALGQTVKYTYDDMGNLTQAGAGANGDVDTVKYFYSTGSQSATGLLERVEYTNGATTKTVWYTHDNAGRVTNVNDWMGGSSNQGHYYQYDALDRITRYTDFDGAYMEYAYDAAGNLTQLRDFTGAVSSFTYDNLHQLASMTAPGNRTWGFSHDPLGRLLDVTLPNGMTTEYEYDGHGRPASLAHKDGSTVVEGWNYGYDDGNNMASAASARSGDGSRWSYLYDGRNRLRHAFRTNTFGTPAARHGFEYDAADNLTSKTVTPLTQLLFDDFADGNLNANPAWTVTGQWSAAGGEAVNTSASTRQEISSATANGDGECWFSYRIDDTSVSGARARVLLRCVTALGNCARVIFYPDRLVVNQTKDGAGATLLENTSVTTLSGQWYDVYVRAQGGTIEVWRGLSGEKMRHCGVTGAAATVLSGPSLVFDAQPDTVVRYDNIRFCAPRSTVQGFTSTFDSTLDGWAVEAGTFTTNGVLANSTPSVSCKAARTVADQDYQYTFSYRGDNGQSSGEAQIRFRFQDWGNHMVLRIQPGNWYLWSLQNGSWSYLGQGTWTTTNNAWYTVTLLVDGKRVEFWRGEKGGAQQRLCASDQATLVPVGQKLILTVPQYGYYSFDDISLRGEDPLAAALQYDAANQLTVMTENGTSVNYSYDAWGRNWLKSRTGALAVYTYGFGDKMAEAASTFPGEASYAQYEYDGLGKRRREAEDYPGTADDRTTWHRWAGWDEISEHGAGASYWEVGALRTTHLPGLAVLEGTAPATAEARYVLGDHLGSVRQLVGQTKAPLARYDYAPYGELSRSAGLPLTVGYTGHRWDQAVGQYFAPFRYYNPKTARWNMRDPLGFVDGPNVYAYVSGNPVTSADPLGLIKECDPNSDTYGNQRGKEDHNGQWPPRPGQSDTRWPKLPDNSDKLDEILDRPHTHIGDAPARDGKNGTPGRNKKAWEWGRNGFLIHENHLYDEETENNKSHREPHYHYQWKDKEGKKHSVKIMPGMRMPNPNCDW